MADALVASAKLVGATHIVFIRHANAAPLPSSAPKRVDKPHGWKMDDQKRALTPKGKTQCEAAAGWFTKLPVRLMLSSPARRATETAVGMGIEPNGQTLPLLMVEALHPAGQEETCETLFETRGYGPLRGFYDAEGGTDAFTQYAEKVVLGMKDRLGGDGASYEQVAAVESDELMKRVVQTVAAQAPAGTHVAVFGHAVFLNAVAHAVCVAAGAPQSALDMVMDMDLGETEGILVPLHYDAGQAVEHCKAS